MQKFIAGVIAVMYAVSGLYAQTDDSDPKGRLAGSYETNTIYYIEDDATNAKVPGSDHIGSNNYFKLDYLRGNLSAGVQIEAYLPVLYGYPSELDGVKFTGYHLSWTDRNFHVTGGTFYDQFGSGLLFRSWEDRALGLNNSIAGARVVYDFNNYIQVKALMGKPRLGMDFADVMVRGGDISLNISEMAGWGTYLSLEASVLNKFQKVPIVLREEIDPNVTGYSGRINYEVGGFSAKAEYVDAGKNFFAYTGPEDPTRSYYGKRGNAQLVELGYQFPRFGASILGRRLEWMNPKFDRNSSSIANVLSYIPSATQQHTYMLTNLNPYTPIIGDMLTSISGELGGQLDLFYNVRKGSFLGGKRGLKLHANMSTYYTIAEEGTVRAGNILFREVSADAEKQLGGKVRLSLLYSMQERNLTYGVGKSTALAHIAVADVLYRITSKMSLRGELQYLHTKEDDKDWMAALVEMNFAPKWSLFFSDMYNHGSTEVHYYNAGVSYAHSRTRLSFSWGRNRAGYVCSGGVCRLVPAYTGANFTLTTSF